MKDEQLAFLDTDKKCPNCRRKKDIRPKGFYTCSKCGSAYYSE